MIDSFLSFIINAKTPFHAADLIYTALSKEGFCPLSSNTLPEHSASYVMNIDENCIIAFRMPNSLPKRAVILASHLDSPTFQLKPRPEVFSDGMAHFLVEPYGSPLEGGWMDRCMALAGRVVGIQRGALLSKIVDLNEVRCLIPNLPPHLAKSKPTQHRQTDFNPLVGLKASELPLLLKKKYGFDDILSQDLFLYPVHPPEVYGIDREFIASPRIDNLSSVYIALQALLQSSLRDDVLQIAFFWNHEEIGSQTAFGAHSRITQHLFEKLFPSLELKKSLAISLDVAHALHPHHKDKYDPQNTPILGKGPAIKQSAAKKYATDALSAASILWLAKKHALPLQHYAAHGDYPSGTTIGPIVSADFGAPTADIGIGCLSMHSSQETMAVYDFEVLYRLVLLALGEL